MGDYLDDMLAPEEPGKKKKPTLFVREPAINPLELELRVAQYQWECDWWSDRGVGPNVPIIMELEDEEGRLTFRNPEDFPGCNTVDEAMDMLSECHRLSDERFAFAIAAARSLGKNAKSNPENEEKIEMLEKIRGGSI